MRIFLLLVLSLCFAIMTRAELYCDGCKRGPFKRLSTHVNKCRKMDRFVERGHSDNIREDARRRAELRARLQVQKEQDRLRREALEREEAQRLARIQVSSKAAMCAPAR